MCKAHKREQKILHKEKKYQVFFENCNFFDHFQNIHKKVTEIKLFFIVCVGLSAKKMFRTHIHANKASMALNE